jgi:hypothetical protein
MRCHGYHVLLQAMADLQQLTGALQVLATADEQWAAYLDAAKQDCSSAAASLP